MFIYDLCLSFIDSLSYAKIINVQAVTMVTLH